MRRPDAKGKPFQHALRNETLEERQARLKKRMRNLRYKHSKEVAIHKAVKTRRMRKVQPIVEEKPQFSFRVR